MNTNNRTGSASVDALEELGVIRREFRDLQTAGSVVNNIMFIDLNVDMETVMKSKHSYDDILRYARSDIEEE